MSDNFFPPIESDRRIAQFLDAWNAAKKDNLVPRKSDFDPTVVPRLLSSIYICEWLPDMGDFQCVLAGEEVNKAWGSSLSGKRLGDVIGQDDHPVICDRWHTILDTPEIHYGMVTERMTEQNFYSAERLTVPLSDKGGIRCYIMGLSLYSFGKIDFTRPALIPEDTIRIACADI